MNPEAKTSSSDQRVPSLTGDINVASLAGKGIMVRSASSVPQVEAASASAAASPFTSVVNGLHSSVSNLANLLPTGTFLAFSAITPLVSGASCDTAWEVSLSVSMFVFFALFCIFSCYTDSYQAPDGKVYYGIVTSKGLWIPQLPEHLHPGDKKQYKLTFTDVIHSILSPVVLCACWLMTPSFQTCFYTSVSPSAVMIVPVFVGSFVSAVFVALPSSRRGVGFPVSPASLIVTKASSRDVPDDQLEHGSTSGGSTSTGVVQPESTQLIPSKNPVE